MNHLQPYPVYKDSSVPWLGDVPEHWDVKRGKWLFQKMDRPCRETDGVVTCFRDGEVTLRKHRRIRGFTESLKEIGYQGIRKGDLVIHAMDAFAGAIGVSDSDGKGTPVYQVLEPTERSNSYYYSFTIREMARNQWILALAKGIRERSTDFRYDDLASQLLPIPPLPEQNAIVRYLDYMDKRIRRYINAKKKLIRLLNEQKQAIIHQAVTCGLDPNVRLKPSELEWLGDIPEHWEVRKLKFIKKPIPNSFVDGPFGSNLKSEHYVIGGDVYVVESGFITSGQFIRRKFKTITNDHFQTIKRSACSGGDIIIAKIGAHYGMAGILPDLDKPAVVSGNSLKLTVNERIANSRYVHEAILTARAFGALEIIVNATAQPALSLGGLNDLSLPFPPLLEQVRLMDHLDKETEYFNMAISAIQREIDLLREYRNRLIADVVTGKLDVREAAANLPEEAERELNVSDVESPSDNGTTVEDEEEALTGVTDDD